MPEKHARLASVLVAYLVALAASGAATQPTTRPRGLVELSVDPGEGRQPAKGPIVVNVTLRNVGDEPVHWWSGGPATYPGAHYFRVQLRQGEAGEWTERRPTNGQYAAGSGGSRGLKRGEQVLVPLAIPLAGPGSVYVRITTDEWRAAKPAEAHVAVVEEYEDDPRPIVTRRARMIETAVQPGEHFWHHVTATYADATVIDALLRIVTVDNPIIAARVAALLADRQSLPEAAGVTLAPLIAQAVSRETSHAWDSLPRDLLRAGLATRHESVRGLAIELIRNERFERATREMLMDVAATSPGDEAWLGRVRGELQNVSQGARDPKVAKRATLELGVVEGRLRGLDSRDGLDEVEPAAVP